MSVTLSFVAYQWCVCHWPLKFICGVCGTDLCGLSVVCVPLASEVYLWCLWH